MGENTKTAAETMNEIYFAIILSLSTKIPTEELIDCIEEFKKGLTQLGENTEEITILLDTIVSAVIMTGSITQYDIHKEVIEA